MRFPRAPLALLLVAAAGCDDPARPDPELAPSIVVFATASYPPPGQFTEESCVLSATLPGDSFPASWSGTLPVRVARHRKVDGQLREVGVRSHDAVPTRIRRDGTRLTVVLGGAVADSLDGQRDPASNDGFPRFVGAWSCPTSVPGALPNGPALVGAWVAQKLIPHD